MKLKKPSLKGVKHTEHLGHFNQDKYIQAGHNDVPMGGVASVLATARGAESGGPGQSASSILQSAANLKKLKSKSKSTESSDDPIGTSYPATEES